MCLRKQHSEQIKTQTNHNKLLEKSQASVKLNPHMINDRAQESVHSMVSFCALLTWIG